MWPFNMLIEFDLYICLEKKRIKFQLNHKNYVKKFESHHFYYDKKLL